MADIFSGYKRSLKCYVSKKLNGIVDVGYPKQYPTATDILNGYFTYNSVQYDIPTPAELSTMSQATYDSLLATFKLYVEAAESGASFATDTIVQPTIYDPSGCAVDIPTTTTTSTTTTTELSPDMTYEIVSDGEGNISTQTTFTVTGAVPADIVTLELVYTGILELDSGYSSTQARLYVSYPWDFSQVLGDCFSDPVAHTFTITKTINVFAESGSFNFTTEVSKINSSDPNGSLTCAITNVNRNGVDYPLNKNALGKFATVITPQFSC